MLEYKGYTGVVSYDDEFKIFHGDVIGIKGTITFKGKSVTEINKEFKKSINSYLDFCKEIDKSPEKSFSGKFVLRINSNCHRKLSFKAMEAGKSLNQYIATLLEKHAI